MKVSTNWLRDYIDFDFSLDELARRLTMAGLEVEATIPVSKQEFAAAGGSGSRDDVVWDAKVTPNRGDWLSMIGVARECAPLVDATARVPVVSVEGTEPSSAEMIKIDIEARDLCRRYVGVVVRNVKIGPSPDWMRDRLIASGIRPINNVVDITNYVMLELGQPLHAFDYSLLSGHRVIVRRARGGESITSIDGEQRKLDPEMLVIADADRAVAIAGIMGGSYSEIGESTKDILIESANFNSVSVRRTAKRLNMVTESSYRFERSVDPSVTILAALRAAELVRDLAGGEVASGAVDVYPEPVEPLTVNVRPDRANSILGTSIKPSAMASYLRSLEIESEVEGGCLECRVPTFRQDITREIDLIEEIGRVYGYDKLDTTLPKRSLQGRDSAAGAFRDRVRRILMSCGAQEVLTHSLVDSSLAVLAGKEQHLLRVRNPLSEELDSMRAVLIPNLLQVLDRNRAYGTTELSVFEIGNIYNRDADGEIGERLSIAGAMVGAQWRGAWNLPADAAATDFFWCKGVVESLLDGLGMGGVRFVEASDALLHPTRGAKVLANGAELGLIGEASPSVLESMDVKGRPCVFELNFDALMSATPAVLRYKELPRFPAMYRHLAVVVSDAVKYDDLAGIVLDAGRALVENVSLLDVYKGEHVGSDQSSITLSLVFRSREKTLTDDEVSSVVTEIREALAQKVGASFR